MDRLRQLSKYLACGLLCVLSGCCAHCGRLLCDGCADIPPGAIPQPTGAHACAWQTTQDALAEQDDFVVYQYEWKGDSTELGPFGQRHVADLVQRLETQPYSIIVEPSGSPSLDTNRTAALANLLAAQGVTAAEERVRAGFPAAEGLHGQEAQRLERGYFRGGGFGGGGGGGLGGGGGGLGGGGGGGLGGGGIF